MIDFRELSDLLVKKGKVRGKPVAVTLFEGAVHPAYEPIQDTPCAIIHYAMDEDRKVYFDAEHNDCLVGVHHAGMVPGKKEIVNGEYLSAASTFFTWEGAARLKAGQPYLPPGFVKAIGAAPLDEVPEGVKVDWVVVVCNPHNANPIAGCRACREGILPYGEFATSLCGVLFATPWYVKNIVLTFGDFGGRMHNRIKQDQLFIILPAEFLHYLPLVLSDMKMDVKLSRQMAKPPHSDFWAKLAAKVEEQPKEDAPASTLFTMKWTDEARELMKKVPEGILEMAVNNAEEYAQEKGYPEVSRKSLEELMNKLGMNLDDMLG